MNPKFSFLMALSTELFLTYLISRLEPYGLKLRDSLIQKVKLLYADLKSFILKNLKNYGQSLVGVEPKLISSL